MRLLHRTFVPLLLTLLALPATTAFAHGDWPAKHGGIMNDGGETSFELVVVRGKATLYVEDHGTAVPTQGARGTFTVTRGTTARSVDLRAAGSNRLETVQLIDVTKGDKAMARVTLGNGSVVVGRFLVR
jgi:hypothetical protein